MKKLLFACLFAAVAAAQPFWTPTSFMATWPRQASDNAAAAKLSVTFHTTLAGLASLDFSAAPDVVYVTDAGRQGPFGKVLTASLPTWAASDVTGMAVSEPGATGKWVRQWDGRANLKWFGAVGDGVTDDTTAVTAALNLGLPLFVPDGTYIIDQINSTNTVLVDVLGESQDNTIFKHKAATVDEHTSTVNQVEIYVNTVLPGGNTYGMVVLTLDTPDSGVINHVRSWQMAWSGETNQIMSASESASEVVWTRDDLYKAQSGVDATYHIGKVTHTSTTVTVTTTAAHGLNPTDPVTLSGLIDHYNGVQTVVSTPTTTSFTFTMAFPSITVSRYEITDNDSMLYFFEPYGVVKFANLTLDGNGVAAKSNNAVKVYLGTWPTGWEGCSLVEFDNVTFDNAPGRGSHLYFRAGYNKKSTDVVVTNCRFYNWLARAIRCTGDYRSVNVSHNLFNNYGGWDGSAVTGIYGAGSTFYPSIIYYQTDSGPVTCSYNTCLYTSSDVISGGWYHKNMNIIGNTVKHAGYNGVNVLNQIAQGFGFSGGKIDDARGTVNFAGHRFEMADELIAVATTALYGRAFEFSTANTNYVVNISDSYYKGGGIQLRHPAGYTSSRYRFSMNNVTFDGETADSSLIDSVKISDCHFIAGADLTSFDGAISGCEFLGDSQITVAAGTGKSIHIVNNTVKRDTDGNFILIPNHAIGVVQGNVKLEGSAVAELDFTAYSSPYRNNSLIVADNQLDMTVGTSMGLQATARGNTGQPDREEWWYAQAGTLINLEPTSDTFGAWTKNSSRIQVSSLPNDGDTLIVDGVTWTWKTVASATRDVTIQGTTTDCAIELRKLLTTTSPWSNNLYQFGTYVFVAGHANQPLAISQTGAWATFTSYSETYAGPINVIVTAGAGSSITKLHAQYNSVTVNGGFVGLFGSRVTMVVADGDTLVSTVPSITRAWGSFDFGGASIKGPAIVDLIWKDFAWHRIGNLPNPTATATPAAGLLSPNLLANASYTVNMGGSLTLTNAANVALGRKISMFLLNGQATNCVLTLDSNWRSFGEASPITVPTGKRVALAFESLGTLATNVCVSAVPQN